MAFLTLKDGTTFEGSSFGYEGDVIGEVVFNTGMTGYQELLTDPSYFGQIVNMTYPLIGNYGINRNDIESDSPKVKGFIVRDYCEVPSNWKSEETLDDYLKEHKIVALYGIDTRALTRRIRDAGAMTGLISQMHPSKEQLDAMERYEIKGSVQAVTTKEIYDIKGAGPAVAVIDYGLKRNIIESLHKLGMNLRIFPCTATAEEILDYNPKGILLTNGPGDPKDNPFEIEQVRKLIGKKPMFGICLGHQLIALAMGGTTEKLPYGHRGSNQPVKDLKTGNVFITGQNHGYTVVADSILTVGEVTHINWNDRTVEGVEYNDGLTFSVQFHPEADLGPQGTMYMFSKFLNMMN